MPGKHITTQQVRLYMSSRKQGQTQEQGSAKAGVSERSGRRIEGGRVGVLGKKERHWRTRKDPFAEVWDSEIVPQLEQQPALSATTWPSTSMTGEPEEPPDVPEAACR